MTIYGKVYDYSRFKKISKAHGIPLFCGFGTFYALDQIKDRIIEFSEKAITPLCALTDFCANLAGEDPVFVVSCAAGVAVAYLVSKALKLLAVKYPALAAIEEKAEDIESKLPEIDTTYPK